MALHAAAVGAAVFVTSLGAFEPAAPRAKSITLVLVRADMPPPSAASEAMPAADEKDLVEASRPVVREPADDAETQAPPADASADVPPPIAHALEAPLVAELAIPPPSVQPVVPSAPPPRVTVGAFAGGSAPSGSREPAGVVRPVQLRATRASTSPSWEGSAVQPAGFDRVQARPGTPAPSPNAETPDLPVEVVFKPLPEYTDEARALRVEGDVIVEVEFSGTGETRVLRVVRGLGHGLDEAAAHAAARIRFKPARRAGRPVDVRTVVHIVFRLA